MRIDRGLVKIIVWTGVAVLLYNNRGLLMPVKKPVQDAGKPETKDDIDIALDRIRNGQIAVNTSPRVPPVTTADNLDEQNLKQE
jgi:hypothetical protein